MLNDRYLLLFMHILHDDAQRELSSMNSDAYARVCSLQAAFENAQSRGIMECTHTILQPHKVLLCVSAQCTMWS
jgi:ribonucleotide reductase beta subunit family protein with ferritin-like domain